MANEFVARKGIISSGSVTVTSGSFLFAPTVSASLFRGQQILVSTGDASPNLFGDSVLDQHIFSGSILTTGSLRVTGTSTIIGNQVISASGTTNDLLIGATGAPKLVVSASGNVTVNGGTLFVDAVNNRVGINTTGSLGATLQIQGSQIISGALTVVTGSGIEFQVTPTGIIVGNTGSDAHRVTGSLGVLGPVRVTSDTTASVNIFGGSLADVHIFSGSLVVTTGSARILGPFTVLPAGAQQFQVLNTGVTIGNTGTDRHTITGSVVLGGDIVISSSLTSDNIFGTNILDRHIFTGSMLVTGSVGIGTTNPTTLLHVEGVTPTITVRGTSTNSAKVNLAGPFTTWSLENQYVNGATNDMFRIYNSALSADAITINRLTNNVGMGTTIPSASLHVNRSSTSGITALVENTQGSPLNNPVVRVSRLNNIFQGGTPTGSGLHIIEHSSNPALYIETHTNSPLLLVSGSGNVGVGTTNPSEKLHVNEGNIRLASTGSFNRIDMGSINNRYYVQVEDSTFDGIGFYKLTPATAGWQFVVNTNGNVGINTISPSATLQVSGSQIIDGGLTVLESGSSIAPLTVGYSTRPTTTFIRVNASSSTFRGYEIQTGGTRRWLMFADSTPDTGADAGSNFSIGAYTDAGSFIDNPIIIIRAAGGNMFLNRPVRVITGSNGVPAINPAGGYGITFPTATNIGFVINSSEAMRIDSNRNVGIGTTSPSALLHVSASGTTNDLLVGTSSAPKLFVSGSGNVGIGDSAPSDRLVVNGRTRISGANVLAFGDSPGGQASIGITSALVGTLTFRTYDGSNFVERMRIVNTTGNVGINTAAPSASLHVSGSAIITGAVTSSTTLISGSGTQRLTVIGSGSAQPLFTVQGSQGELFSIVDNLSGSLFSVNDISGLPILEVFSDDTVLMGDYLAPSLNTTKRLTLNTGSNVIYSVPTASYDSIHIEYNIKSASVGRTGNFIGFNVGTASASLDTYTSSIGDTSTVIFQSFVSGANLVVTGSVPTNGWTYKAIIRAI